MDRETATDRASARQARETRPAIVVVGVSGPDGAGKSSLVAGLGESLRGRGALVGTAYLYGCVVCRHLPPGAGDAVLRRAMSGRSGRVSRSIARGLRAGHAFVDAAELSVRLATSITAVGFRARLRPGRHGPAFLLTDRSPLDGLAKHLHATDSISGRVYRRLAARYRTIFLLCAPPDVLVARDGDHGVATLSLAALSFDVAAALLPNVVPVDTGAATLAEIALAAAEALGTTRGPDDEAAARPGWLSSTW